MTFQRIIVGLLILTIAGLAGSFYLNWKINNQLQTMKAFVEGSVFAEAVAACEKAPSTTPFKWNGGARTSVIGLNWSSSTNTGSFPATRWSRTVSIAISIRSRGRPMSDQISSSGNENI